MRQIGLTSPHQDEIHEERVERIFAAAKKARGVLTESEMRALL